MKIIDGKKPAQAILKKIKRSLLKTKTAPGLGIVFVGDDLASEHYIELKKRKAEELGFHVEIANLPKNISQKKLIEKIKEFNLNKKINGIIVQLPLPKHLDSNSAINAIDPRKDADGIHPLNLGKLATGDWSCAPATPSGIIYLLEKNKIQIAGQHAVVLGRSNIVGKPIALMLIQKNATVTVCHSKTKNLAQYAKQADILVVSIGRPKMITAQMIKKGACIIDVGSTKIGNNWVGDVDFENVKNKVGYITPVPGGIGPMTVAMLLQNTLKLKYA